jgi:hypothetical protein
MSANAGYEIRVLLAGNCPDDETCFMVGEVSARPGKVQLVAKEITDQRLIAAYQHKIGPGEVLVEVDKPDILGVTDA